MNLDVKLLFYAVDCARSYVLDVIQEIKVR